MNKDEAKSLDVSWVDDLKDLSPWQRRELRRCARSFLYFSRNYLRIRDRAKRLVHLDPWPAQVMWLKSRAKNRNTLIVKSRKLGLTTIISAFYFWKVMFNFGHEAIVTSLDTTSTRYVFRIYSRYYKYLPLWMRRVKWFTLTTDNRNEMEFAHDGYILAITAGRGAEGARSATFNYIHLTEAAKYSHFDEVMNAVLNTAADNPDIVLETTARGRNRIYDLWVEQNGFEKLFIGWQHDPAAMRFKKPREIHPKLHELAIKQKLTRRQVYWGQHTLETKCGNSWKSFCQERPCNANMAFIATSDRFFEPYYEFIKAESGAETFEEPKKYRIYVLGCDTASGSPFGTDSAIKVLDVTDKKHPRDVYKYNGKIRPSDFAKMVLEVGLKYGAMVVPEINANGIVILNHLVDEGYPYIYRRVKYDNRKAESRYREQLGFATREDSRWLMLQRISAYINRGMYEPRCKVTKSQVNTFVFGDNQRGEAAPGCLDDMIIATALAMMGIDQTFQVEQERVWSEAPSGVEERLRWEAETCKYLPDHKGRFLDQRGENPAAASPSEALGQIGRLGN